MIRIKDIPNAEANGVNEVKWLMASGVKTKEEALNLAKIFIKHVKITKEELDNEI